MSAAATGASRTSWRTCAGKSWASTTTRRRGLLRPGGVLAVIGLHPIRTPADFIYAIAGKLYLTWMRVTRAIEPMLAPIRDPEESLNEIRAAVERILPGAHFQRELLFRYLLTWRKP